MELVTLKTCDSAIEAHMIRSKLESEEIACYVFDENMVTLNALYANAVGGIKLKINRFDIDRALLVLEEIEQNKFVDSDNQVVHCPDCNSTDFYDHFKSFRGIKGMLSLIFSFAFLTYPLFYKTVYKCKKCGNEMDIS